MSLARCPRSSVGSVSDAKPQGRPLPRLALTLAILSQQLTESRIGSDGIEVVILFHVAKIAVAKFDRLAKCHQSHVELTEQSVATGEIVTRGRIGRSQRDELLVDLQSFLEPPPNRQVTGLSAKDFGVVRRCCQNTGVEIEFEIHLISVGQKRQHGTGGEAFVGR